MTSRDTTQELDGFGSTTGIVGDSVPCSPIASAEPQDPATPPVEREPARKTTRRDASKTQDVSPEPHEEPHKPCVVYKLYSHYDSLAYVGISGNFSHRLSQHRRSKPWFDEIARIELEHFDTRQEATEREKHLIWTEQPIYNVEGNPSAGAEWCWECWQESGVQSEMYWLDIRHINGFFVHDGWVCNGAWHCENCNDHELNGRVPERAKVVRWREGIMDELDWLMIVAFPRSGPVYHSGEKPRLGPHELFGEKA